jgi:hypothetical protein
MRWVVHMARREDEKSYKVVTEKPERKNQLPELGVTERYY